jgi:rhodanese-related sulfurtransferase
MNMRNTPDAKGRPVRKARLIAGVVLIGSLGLGTTACSNADTTADSSATSSGDSTLRTVDVQAFNNLITSDESIKVIDVRTPQEFASGHIAGASNIDFENSNFGDEIAKLDRSAKYAIYCRSGNRSGQALEQMKSAGFTNVTNLDGGTLTWTAAGFSLE